jgi:hypothetical protein
MFNPTDLVIQSFVKTLSDKYTKTFGSLDSSNAEIIAWAGTMALEIIADTDALYHNLEHTIHVTLVGQEILGGKHLKEGGVTPKDWTHFVISLLCHDIGYLKGVCRGDDVQNMTFVTGVDEPKTITLARGATDAALTKYHVDRGKLFVRERFSNSLGGGIDPELIAANIELTRFPVPKDGDHDGTTDYPGLVRAADLMGQMSDPKYLKKIPALYHEFAETGEAKKNGWNSPQDVAEGYPAFFWKGVLPYVTPALYYLQQTQMGKLYTNNLLSGVFRAQFLQDLQGEKATL